MGCGYRRNKRRYGGKRKFRGNQHTSSQTSSKKSLEEDNPANVSASYSKLDNSILFDKSYDVEKINGECSTESAGAVIDQLYVINYDIKHILVMGILSS